MNIIFKSSYSEAKKRLNAITKKANTLQWRKAGDIVKNSIVSSFDTAGNYESDTSIMGGIQKWRPRKKQVSWKILNKTGKLQRSIYVKPSTKKVVIGSAGIDYNRAHNLGNPRKNLVARPFLVVLPSDLFKIKLLFKRYLSK